MYASPVCRCCCFTSSRARAGSGQLLSADVGAAVGGGPVLPEDLVRVLQAHCMSK